MNRTALDPLDAGEGDSDVNLASAQVRVAHELHDGVIQSLIGVKLQLGALRASRAGANLDPQLAEIEEAVGRSIIELRDLILCIKPVRIEAVELPAAIAQVAERFGRDSGIHTQCLCNGLPGLLSAEACGQIMRIAQEALTNVRRHSGARNVLVSLTCEAARLRLVVDDDGCGFLFEGRWDQDALDRARRGPLVIKERVRLLSGTLTIHSSPGRGARLEIDVPCGQR